MGTQWHTWREEGELREMWAEPSGPVSGLDEVGNDVDKEGVKDDPALGTWVMLFATMEKAGHTWWHQPLSQLLKEGRKEDHRSSPV